MILLLVVKLCDPISITKSPVKGSYVVPDAAVKVPLAPALAVRALVTPLTKLCVPPPVKAGS